VAVLQCLEADGHDRQLRVYFVEKLDDIPAVLA